MVGLASRDSFLGMFFQGTFFLWGRSRALVHLESSRPLLEELHASTKNVENWLWQFLKLKVSGPQTLIELRKAAVKKVSFSRMILKIDSDCVKIPAFDWPSINI